MLVVLHRFFEASCERHLVISLSKSQFFAISISLRERTLYGEGYFYDPESYEALNDNAYLENAIGFANLFML